MISVNSHFVYLADDTTVYLEGRNLAQLCHVMNVELVNVDAWLCSNRLSLNVDKTELTIYSNNSKVVNVDLTIKYQNIIRGLGLIIDDELHFKERIKFVCNKISKSSGSYLEWCGSYLEWCGSYLQWCGSYLQWCGSYLEWCGSYLE